MSSAYTTMEYRYRDGGNFKADGSLLLRGAFTTADEIILRDCCDSYAFFVAEQVNVPTLYQQLWMLSGGPTESDHAFHEFVCLRTATKCERESLVCWGELSTLLWSFLAGKNKWKCALSPHAYL